MNVKKVALYGMLVALAMVLSFLESLIPPVVAIPGVKLGLTNLVVMAALYRMKPGDAFFINIIRIVLSGITFGNGFSLIYSLAGGGLSFFAMWSLFRLKKEGKRVFSPVGVGAIGGVTHNIGQLAVAFFVMKTGGVFFYLPPLLISGVISGTVIGIICGLVIKRLPREDGIMEGSDPPL